MIEQNHWARRFFYVMAAVALLVAALPALAQEGGQQRPAMAATAGESQSAAQGASKKQASSTVKQTGSQDDRLFWTLPNLLTVENENLVPPLTPGGKFKLLSRQAFDPIEYPFIGFLALISQAQNSEPAFGQGAAGYAKRYGASFGDATIGSYMTGAVFPALLRQDPRYYQLGKGGFVHRTGYSIGRIFITRTDAGRAQFNYSEIGGNAIAAGISNAYHPRQDRSVANTMSVWWTDIGWDTVSNVAKEFWPDIRRMLSKKPAPPLETLNPD
ncbi:MAG TPA: hypothetical protein VGS20_06615 [Candidatus Acidoferrales bacterium]|nr:hypothetical protein [Candidatus Acidoferrales bacterium]